MSRELLKLIDEKFPLEKQDAGEFKNLKVSVMKFEVESYESKGLGHVSFMNATGMFGLMKMETLIINPFYVDAPLLSFDHIFAMGNETLYVEPFETTVGHNFDSSEIEEAARKVESLVADHDIGTHWYDDMRLKPTLCKKDKKKKEEFARLKRVYLMAYLEAAAKAATCDIIEKKKASAVYSDGLIVNGGPATDPMKKALSEEKTKEFFDKILFGCGIE